MAEAHFVCVFFFVMHTDQKGYDHVMACGFNESFDKPGLFYPWLKLTFSHFLLEKQICIKNLLQGNKPILLGGLCFKSNLDIAAMLKGWV